MNTRLLRKVQKHILEEPKRLCMADWCQKKSEFNLDVEDFWDACNRYPFAKCGTAACIGGWAVLLNGGRIGSGMGWKNPSWHLGLSRTQADLLFNIEDWPDRFYDRYRTATTPAAKARVAVRRIDHFIKTKGAE